MSEDLISKELRETLTDDQADLLIGIADTFKKGGVAAKQIPLLNPTLVQAIENLKAGQGLFLTLGGSFFELRRLDSCLNLDRCRVYACARYCWDGTKFVCC